KARKIADFRHVVCAAPKFLKNFGSVRHPSDLQSAPGLCYGNLPYPAIWTFRGPDGESGTVTVTPRLEATNGGALREAAIAGHGFLCEPSFIVHAAVEQGLLCPLLTDYRWHDMAIYAVYPATRHLSSRVRRFLDFVSDRFGSKPYWNDFLEDAPS
ncbi:MAG: substrate binding domain-containing protein, partial [Methyloceanibacter sp.]|nr:substrate binding domain-containing protein [Methyloceanibacter sp.]